MTRTLSHFLGGAPRLKDTTATATTGRPRRRIRPTGRGFFAGAALLLACLSGRGLANPHVVLPTGERIVGRQIARDDQGRILLTTEQAVLTFPSDTIIHVPEPPEYGRAVHMIQRRAFTDALQALDGIIAAYRNLQWDRRARILKAGVLHDAGRFDEAADLYAIVREESPDALDDSAVLSRYIEALRRSDRDEAWMELIVDTIRQRSRAAAAHAQMARGRWHMAQHAHEDALLDFLRTAELFPDVEAYQEEALAMTAQALARRNDPRAEAFQTRLREAFPDSRWLREEH